MKKELQNKLKEKYPSLFNQSNLPNTRSLMCYGCAIGDGWYDIFDKMCEKIIEVDTNKQVSFSQVKEKFGYLRVYADSGDIKREKVKIIQEIINQTEGDSATVCESCGKPGEQRRGEWIKVLCDECLKKEKK